MLVRLLRAGSLEPHYYGIPEQAAANGGISLDERAYRCSPDDRRTSCERGVLSGFEFGPGALNPYRQFSQLRPVAVIDDGRLLS